VCHEIAQNIRINYFPRGTRQQTAQMCAFVDLESYTYDEKIKKEAKLTYLEYQLNKRCMCIIIIKHLNETEKSISEQVMNGIKNQAAAFACYHSTVQ